MSQLFAALGVSAPLVEVLDRLGIKSPFAIQDLVLRGRSRRSGHPRRSPDRLRQDARLRHPDDHADGRCRRASERARARPDARTRLPDRRRSAAACRSLRPAGRSRLRRNLGRGSGEEGSRSRDPRRHSGKAPGPPRAASRLARIGSRPRPRRGRPHVGHGLPAPGRPNPRADSAESADHAVLGDARRPGGRSRSDLHGQRVPVQHRSAGRRPRRRRRSRVRAGDCRGQARAPGRAARAGARARARLRSHEARCRQARPEARTRPRHSRLW